jgi:hypothetical protein
MMDDRMRARAQRTWSRRDVLLSLGVTLCVALGVTSLLVAWNRTHGPVATDRSIAAAQPAPSAERPWNRHASDGVRPAKPVPSAVPLADAAAARADTAGTAPPLDAADAAQSALASEPLADLEQAGRGPAAPQATTPLNTFKPSESNLRKLLQEVRAQLAAGDVGRSFETMSRLVESLPDDSSATPVRDGIRQAKQGVDAGQQVDFDSLIDLLTNTVAPNSWDKVGGPGTVQRYAGGVYADTAGQMHYREGDTSRELAEARAQARAAAGGDPQQQPHGLRTVSLPRLEAEIARRLDAGERLSDEMRHLAGLSHMDYLVVVPDQRDVLLVGPAEEWQADAFGRSIGVRSGHPMYELDDLVVVLRACFSDSVSRGVFGCGIYPRTERLQQVQQFLAASAAAGPISPARRERWLAELRDQLGEQDIRVFGVPAGCRVSQVMVEADYRMKRVGIGLEAVAVEGIPSYFDLLGTPDEAALARGLATLRWWFTLGSEPITATAERDAFDLRGPHVRVQSENEMITAAGERVATGWSEPASARFARSFTEHFAALADRDANYADLAHVFDLAVVAALLRGHDVPRSIGWPMACFGDPDEYLVMLYPVPRSVETVMSHRVYGGRHILAAISGGVHADPWALAAPERIRPDSSGVLAALRASTMAPAPAAGRWWWNASPPQEGNSSTAAPHK